MCDHSVSIMVFLIVRIEGIEGTAKPLIGLLTLLGLPRLVCLPLGRLEEGGKGGREEGRKGGQEGGREKGRGRERERGREGGGPSHFFPSSISSFLPPFLRLGVSVSFPLSLLLPSSLPPFLPSPLPPFLPSSLPHRAIITNNAKESCVRARSVGSPVPLEKCHCVEHTVANGHIHGESETDTHPKLPDGE